MKKQKTTINKERKNILRIGYLSLAYGSVFLFSSFQLRAEVGNTISHQAMDRKDEVAVIQQGGTCSGVIKDASGEFIIGASVIVKGTTNGTMTGIDGDFTLNNVPTGSTIIISYIGYEAQEVKWTGTPLNIILKENLQILDEVVVVAYGTQKKVNVTGAVSMVGSEVIESRPVANVSQALQGAIPGLNLTTSSSGGDLNTGMNINIRGTGSISSSDKPLILIDGIEGDLNLVNPNDIESVSVLKDAASASIYGTRAAFGVILVTTKSGKAGKVRVTYSGDVRFSTATQVPEMVDSYAFATFFNAANKNAGAGNYFSDETMENILKFQRGEFTDPTQPEYYGTTAGSNGRWNLYGGAFANTDWFEEFYKKNVPSTQHNLSLSGGSEKFVWSVSGSFLLQNGLIKHGHDELDRYTINAKIGAQLTDWIRLDYTNKWTRKDYTKPQYLTGLFFHNIARRWPTCFPIDPNGHWGEGMEIAELEDGGTYNENNDLFTQQLRFTIEPLKEWRIHLEGSMRNTYNKTTTNRIPVYHYTVDNTPFLRNSGYGTETYVYDNRYKQNYYTVNVYSDYARSFGLHNGTVMAGLNYERYDQDNLWGSGTNLTTSNKPYLSQAQSNKQNGDSYWNRATAGYFGRLNYDYDGRYLFEFNIRYDGSSRFVGDKRWAWFPSVSLGWNIAREAFFGSLSDKISMLKLRASWGQLGNTSSNYNSFTDWYPFYQQQAIGAASGTWLINGEKQNTSSLPGIVSSLLTWETVETWDIGLDWAALNNRLTGTFDWFTRTTKDMIGPAPTLGSALGTSAPQINNCDMRSTGWELEIAWKDQINQVKYGARLNISDAQQKILTYPNETGSLSTYYDGKKLNEIWGYTTQGIANSQEEMDTWIANNRPNWGSNWSAGDIMYKDLNDDGVVSNGDNTLDNHGDLRVIGNATPRYRVGLNLDVAWKGIDFSVFFQGVMKRDWAFGQGDAYFWGSTGNVWQSAAFKEHLDYWREDNRNAYYAKPYFGGVQKNQTTQTRFLQDASYLRCKNMQVGYTLPHVWVNKVGIENCRVYLSCDNLFTITDLSGIYDPEAFGGYGDEGWGSGKTYPLQRTFAIGLSLNF